MLEEIREFIGTRDPRVLKYPLMKYHLTPVVFSLIYLAVIKVIGPIWMKNRKPYNLRHVMLAYNAFVIVLNIWITTNFFILMKSYKSWLCEPVDTSNNPQALKIVQVAWVFYLSKIVDYFDTIFFILRKKHSQVNFLHVFHHSTVPVTVWFSLSYAPGGFNAFLPITNSFVHIWMYLYYGLSAMGPKYQKYLFWKKYMTLLQIAQFLLAMLFFGQLLLIPRENCKVSLFAVWISLGQCIIYFGLFMNFYFKSYKVKIRKYKDVKYQNTKSQ